MRKLAGYDEIVPPRDIRFESHCEHHMAPIIGRAHIAYLPERRVVGISKLARLVEVFAKRLQIQERMTAEIAQTIDQVLKPRGVAVVIEAVHECMTTRGVHSCGVSMGDKPDAGRIPRYCRDPTRISRRHRLAAWNRLQRRRLLTR